MWNVVYDDTVMLYVCDCDDDDDRMSRSVVSGHEARSYIKKWPPSIRI